MKKTRVSTAFPMIWTWLAVMLLLSGCLFIKTPPTPTPFPQPTASIPVSITLTPTTVSRNTISWRDLASDDYGTYYEDYSKSFPRLIVVSDLTEVDKIKEGVREEHIVLLKQVDYSDWIPLIIFSGWHGTTGYSIRVQSVELIDNVVRVSAEFLSPAPKQTLGDAVTHPYLIIAIQRSVVAGTITFELVVDQQIISQSKKTFPKP